MTNLGRKLNQFLEQKDLPDHYLDMLDAYIKPLANWLLLRKYEKPLVVGINGAQGSGKSTLCSALTLFLEDAGYTTATLSIDDLYLGQTERSKLAQIMHPMFQTRGVPGTHDVSLGLDILEQLIAGNESVVIPRFDKSKDERKPSALWTSYQSPVDIVLFEGWCVATPAQSPEALKKPINMLEQAEDKNGIWRTHANDFLSNQYQPLFDLIDVLIYLQIPDFSSVFEWRKRQEIKTFEHQDKQGMNDAELSHFIQYFERLTRVAAENLPHQADVVLGLDEQHCICQAKYKGNK
ncbi:MAG: P-loop NTPase fold protein [Ghiorsea sp.]